ncbi:polyhydroxyalkanoic acid system protein [Zhengella mangrovi]|uniref:Polyhydroxyalkanoic acid system protein n=1 Tax=Zhengella mangrovi TaxID=1982044 RepID=A0A2G1QIW4_9HYPH|nr:polyhydroxyalkanoic acid system family protein [Zhengella mangrovi]PHP65487.1 polyhydroxyalkanoic acid system protein [Zhengella mangrovi]
MAKPVTITVSHELGREQALQRVRDRFDQVEKALGMGVRLDKQWNGDQLNFSAGAFGQTVTGTVDVSETDMTIVLMLPTLLAGMAGKLSETLGKQSRLLLSKE